MQGAADHLKSYVWSEDNIDGVLPGPVSNIDAMLNQPEPDVAAVNYMIKDVRKCLEEGFKAECLAKETCNTATIDQGVQMIQKAVIDCEETVPHILSKERRYNRKEVQKRILYEKFNVTFGVWNVLAAMIAQSEFLKLQALNHFTYDVSISRSQIKLKFDDRLKAFRDCIINEPNLYFTYPNWNKFKTTIFEHTLADGETWHVRNPSINAKFAKTIQIGKEVISVERR